MTIKSSERGAREKFGKLLLFSVARREPEQIACAPGQNTDRNRPRWRLVVVVAPIVRGASGSGVSILGMATKA